MKLRRNNTAKNAQWESIVDCQCRQTGSKNGELNIVPPELNFRGFCVYLSLS